VTMRVVLLVGGTLLAAITGSLIAAVILLARDLDTQTARIEATRDRLIEDEIAICAVLRFNPDPEQSRQIAALARALDDQQIASAATRSAAWDRLPNRCMR
jgi:hypothetical protein